MRFTADGVDIPDELLWAQDEGRVVFFCGAGVSLAKANLPNFNGLTKQVLDGLGALPDDEARKLFAFMERARTEAGITTLGSADHVFQLLRRSFTDADIEAKVAECLRPSQSVNLDAHRILLRLAKLQTGETRIVTTNFDRLFEQCNPKLASLTRSVLPRLAFNEADWGIVHLHGCVEPDYSGPTADGFVLSSAAFGNAYLAMGWARDFVKEILDRYVAVFVGYSADDPPIRYLLEGLQQSNGPANRAYAFQAGPNDAAVASWDEKGVQALLYDVTEGCGHRRLWDALEGWSTRTASPAKWRRRTLNMARRGPSKLMPHERGMVAHIVSSKIGAQAFAEHVPTLPAEWLCVFDPLVRYGEPRSAGGPYSQDPVVDPFDHYGLDSDPAPLLKDRQTVHSKRMPEDVWSALNPLPNDFRDVGVNHVAHIRGHFSATPPYLPLRLSMLAWWIAKASHQPAAVWWAGQQHSLHSTILERRGFRQKQQNQTRSDKVVDAAWSTISEYHDLKEGEEDRVFDIDFSVGEDGPRDAVARQYARHFSPRLRLNTIWRRTLPPNAGPSLKLKDLVDVDVEYPESILTVSVPDNYLRHVLPKLTASLQLADELEDKHRSYVEISSIEEQEREEDQGDSFERTYKLSGRILAFSRLFKRLAEIDPVLALSELQTWPRRGPSFTRLRVWALGNLSIAPAGQYALELLSLSHEDFWPFRGERDLLLGLSKRWAEFDKKDRAAIQKRILKGPPRYQRNEADYATRAAHQILSRINWLSAQGCQFTFDLDAVNTRLRAAAPEWQPEYAAGAADTHEGRGGWVRTETGFAEIEDLAADEIIPHVESMDRRPPGLLVQRDPFLGLSREQPEKALSALKACTRQRRLCTSFWQSFLRTDIRSSDGDELRSQIGESLLEVSDEQLSEIIRSAADWFEKAGKSIQDQSEKLFDGLWSRFLRVLATNAAASRSSLVRENRAPDWTTEAINSAAGDLAELIVSNPPKATYEPGETFARPWLQRLEDLLALPGDSRRYALVLIGHQLRWFFSVDPKWTEKNVLSVFDGLAFPEADREAVWAGVYWSAHVPQPELYVRLKPHLMENARKDSTQGTRHIEINSGMLLAGWNMRQGDAQARIVSSEELRALIIQCDAEFRLGILRTLDRWYDDSELASQNTATFLREVWPRQKSIRTPQTSSKLCEIALSQKYLFDEIAAIVIPLMSKVLDDRLFIPELRKSDESIALEHPEAMLGLLHAVLPENRTRWPYGADTALKALGEKHPAIQSDPRYIELEGKAH